MWDRELEISKTLAVKAGEAIMKIYNKTTDFSIEYKDDNSPLTKADEASNEIIVNGLKSSFSDYAILSEEEKDNLQRLENDLCFIVDPLDGTKEFIKRNGQFTVNIALSYKHKAVMGVIYVPVTKDMYFAAQGMGSFRLSENGECEKLKVSEEKDKSKLKAVMSSSHNCKEMDDLIQKFNINNFVKMGSSLKGCLVASGEADIYYRFNPTMEWDTAAMQCIVEEAGGIFRQMDKSEMQYNRENSLNDKGFFAVNCEENVLV